MSGFLEGLARRGAGLGAAPGEQTATLRPLSRFELRPFDGAEGASSALPESESFVPAATPQHGHESVPVRERAAALRSPAASTPDDRPSPVPGPAPDLAVAPGPRATEIPPSAPDFGRVRETPPPAAMAQPVAPAQTPVVHAPAMPAPETRAVPAPAEPQGPVVHAVTRHEEVTLVASAPMPPVAAASPHPPHPRPDTRPLGEEPDVSVHRADPATPEQSPRALAPPPPAPLQHASHDAPAPQTTITIGRIEIDFGQKPAAPPAPPRPQRTRGFAAYARARRGQAR